MTEQISADQIVVLGNKDAFLFEIVRAVSAITVTGIFPLPFFRKRDQPDRDAFRISDFFYRHVFSPVPVFLIATTK